VELGAEGVGRKECESGRSTVVDEVVWDYFERGELCIPNSRF